MKGVLDGHVQSSLLGTASTSSMHDDGHAIGDEAATPHPQRRTLTAQPMTSLAMVRRSAGARREPPPTRCEGAPARRTMLGVMAPRTICRATSTTLALINLAACTPALGPTFLQVTDEAFSHNENCYDASVNTCCLKVASTHASHKIRMSHVSEKKALTVRALTCLAW